MNLAPAIAVIAPLLRLPRHHQLFDYKIPLPVARIGAGALVMVPFRGRPVKGVVIKIKQRSRFANKLKPIIDLLAANYVSPRQMKLAQRLAAHYGVALSLVLKASLPVLPNRRYQPDDLIGLKQVKSLSRRPLNFVFTYDRETQRQELIISLVKKVLARRQQVLLLVPERHWVSYWQNKLPAAMAGSTALALRLHQFLPDDKLSQRRIIWEACRQGQPVVVIGNRSALFLPFNNLGGVIIDQAEDDSYKQWERQPRYDAIEVAGWLGQINQAGLALVSVAPNLAWQRTVAGCEFRWRRFAAHPAPFDLIDMTEQRRGGDRGIVAFPLRERISYYLKRGGKIFLYLNRRGTARVVICRDCGYYPICSTCQRALVWDATVNKMVCFHCRAATDIEIPCPVCHGINLAYRGSGLNRLAGELTSFIPANHDNKPVIIEGESSKINPAALRQARLILGSEAAWPQLNLSEFSLVGFIAPDGELAIPEFSATQSIWQKVRRVLSYNISTIVQTYQPDHYLWQSLIKNQPRLFYRAEALDRQRYGYPPYRQLVRLTIQGDNEAAVYKQACLWRQRLQNNPIRGVAVAAVYPDYYRRLRGRYRYHILIKYQSGAKLNKLWEVLPDEVIIDRHPRTILS